MADNQKIVARIEPQPDDSILVRSPGVGVVDRVPEQGIYLNPMASFVRLRVLNHWQSVLLPRNVKGWVTERFVTETHHPVEYNQPLVRLRRGLESGAEAATGAGGAGGDEQQDQDLITVAAPSEGIFYRRPGPDSPSYVEEGSAVENGTVLGLVEVMKSFNQILYGGPGLPERGTVARICAEDNGEVTFGQALFLIKAGRT